MKKGLKSKIALWMTLLVFSGCSNSWFDVNVDPNNPAEVTTELVLTAGIFEVGTVVGGHYNIIGGMWSQYFTQSNAANQYKTLDGYNINAEDGEDQWRELYAGALNDLNYCRKKAEAQEQWDVYLMSTTMMAYTYQVLVDFYDQIPFTESLNSGNGNFSPNYDSAETVYDGLIVMIDEALAKEMPLLSSLSNSSQDFLFQGDVEKWRAFANTLKLKIYMRQMNVRESVASAGIGTLSISDLLIDDAILDIYVDEKNKDNPFYSSNIRNLNVGTNLRVSSTIFNYLENNEDPRLAVVNGGAPDGTAGIPLPQGGFNYSSTVVDPTKVAVFKQSPTTPVYFFSKAECNFLIAEAIAKGWLNGDAKSYYDEGVKAAFEMYDLDGTSMVAAGGVYEYPSGTFAENQKAIIMQKWMSMVGIQGCEAFFETNRTGIPEESTVAAGTPSGPNPDYLGGARTYSMGGTTGGKFPKRLVVPNSERNSNENIPSDLLTSKVYDKVWWNK